MQACLDQSETVATTRASRRLDAIWDLSFEALLIVDTTRRYVRVNPAAEELLGASRETILRTRVETFTPPNFLDRLDDFWDELEERGDVAGVYLVQRGDGSNRWVEFRARTELETEQHIVAARHSLRGRRHLSGPVGGPDAQRLTDRQRQVLQLAAEGLPTREIADRLVVSANTVRTHLDNIYERLGVGDRAAAVAAGFRMGLIE
jgi:PAS domain S-box-containing protein